MFRAARLPLVRVCARLQSTATPPAVAAPKAEAETEAVVAEPLQTANLLGRLAQVNSPSTVAIPTPSYNAANEFTERREREAAAIKAGIVLPDRDAPLQPVPELQALISSVQPKAEPAPAVGESSSESSDAASTSSSPNSSSSQNPQQPSSSKNTMFAAGLVAVIAAAAGFAVWSTASKVDPSALKMKDVKSRSSPSPAPAAPSAPAPVKSAPAPVVPAAAPATASKHVATPQIATSKPAAPASATTVALSAAVAQAAAQSTAAPSALNSAPAAAVATAASAPAVEAPKPLAPSKHVEPVKSPEELALEAARVKAERAELERFLDLYFANKNEAELSAALLKHREALRAQLEKLTADQKVQIAEQRRLIEQYASTARRSEQAASTVSAMLPTESNVSAAPLPESLEEAGKEIAMLRHESASRSGQEASRLMQAVRLTEQSERAAALELLRQQEENIEHLLAAEIKHREAAWQTFAEKFAERSAAHKMATFQKEAAEYLEARAVAYAHAAADEYRLKLAHQNKDWAAKFDAERTMRLNKIQDLETRVAAFAQVFDWQSQYEAVGSQLVRMQLALMQVEQCVESVLANPGASASALDAALKKLTTVAKGDVLVEAALQSIPTSLPAGGVPTAHALLSSFDFVEQEARQLSMIPEGSGVLGHLLGTAFGSRMRPERANVQGTDAQARLSRAGFYLEGGDLSRAVLELEGITGLPAKHGSLPVWLQGARARLTVLQATDVIRAHLRLVAAAQANIVAAKKL